MVYKKKKKNKMSEESKKTETEGRNSEDSWKSDKEVE